MLGEGWGHCFGDIKLFPYAIVKAIATFVSASKYVVLGSPGYRFVGVGFSSVVVVGGIVFRLGVLDL